jgi:hypothetical protein
MRSYLGKNRLQIAEYFSELKATVDIHVETYIAENQLDRAEIDKLNNAREGWFKEANECEASNLAELEKREDRDLNLTDKKLLKRFGFIFKFYGDVIETGCFIWRFVSTDKYLSPRQIASFQVMVEHLGCENRDYEQAPLPGIESFRMLFKICKSEMYDVSKLNILIKILFS